MMPYKAINIIAVAFSFVVGIYSLIHPIFSIELMTILFAVSIAILTYFLVQTIFMGPLGPLAIRRNFERIGLVNRIGETPLLLRIKNNEKVNNGLILEFHNRNIKREKWEDVREDIEAALNIFIISISDGKDRRRVLIEAVPASHGLPKKIVWDDRYLDKSDFTLAIGMGLTGLMKIDLSVVPHLIVGGGTGSGKSVLVRLLIHQILEKGGSVHLLDAKGGIDFAYMDHLALHLHTTMQEFVACFKEHSDELKVREQILKRAGCTNLKEYNSKNPLHQHKRIFIVCDEVAEILDKTGLSKEEKELVDQLTRDMQHIARLGRAVGIHLVLSTQRPDANTLPPQVKSNAAYRICGRADLILSQIILDNGDAHDTIPKNSQGRFLLSGGDSGELELFQAFWYDPASVSDGHNDTEEFLR